MILGDYVLTGPRAGETAGTCHLLYDRLGASGVYRLPATWQSCRLVVIDAAQMAAGPMPACSAPEIIYGVLVVLCALC